MRPPSRSPMGACDIDRPAPDVYTGDSFRQCASDRKVQGVCELGIVFILIVLVALFFGWIKENM